MPAIRKSLPVQLSSRDNAAAKDGLLTNCYIETTPSGPCIFKGPGDTLSASLTAGQAQGGITYNNLAHWVVGDALALPSSLPSIGGSSWTSASSNPLSGARTGAGMGSDGTNLYL